MTLQQHFVNGNLQQRAAEIAARTGGNELTIYHRLKHEKANERRSARSGFAK